MLWVILPYSSSGNLWAILTGHLDEDKEHIAALTPSFPPKIIDPTIGFLDILGNIFFDNLSGPTTT